MPGNWCFIQVLHGNFSMKNSSLIISNLARARLVQMQMSEKLGNKQGSPRDILQFSNFMSSTIKVFV